MGTCPVFGWPFLSCDVLRYRVKRFPETPALAEVDGLSGHVWVQELPTGGEFRFQVASSGLLTFATDERSFDTVESVPPPYRRAARTITERLDRAALRAATDDPGAVTFCGIATWNDGIAYPWDSVPTFVGTDVWSTAKETFLSPDAATGVFDRLGLASLPAMEKELPVAHADFGKFDDDEEFPDSAWRDGRAAGVLIRDKAGGRAGAWRANTTAPVSTVTQQSATDLAETYATDERIRRTIRALESSGQPLTVASIRDRLVADVAREAYGELYPDGTFVGSLDGFRSAVAERVQQHQFTGE